jgi:putative acetyltransferase
MSEENSQMTLDTLHIRETKASDPQLRTLITRLDEELNERYPAEAVFTLDLEDPAMEDVTFVIAEADGEQVGCGAIRPLDGEHIELKRFYVDRRFRRKGVASRMLAYLEERARQRGFKKLRLETGEAQPESIALYRKFGYEPIDRYGDYVDCELSLCFEKTIGR